MTICSSCLLQDYNTSSHSSKLNHSGALLLDRGRKETMAAEAVLSAFFQVLFDKLATPMLKEFESLLGIKRELAKLPITLAKVQAVLNDAEEKQNHDEAVKIWLKELKDVAYDMDDILDELTTELALYANVESDPGQSGRNTVCTLLSSLTMNLYQHEVASRINDIHRRLDEIVKEKEDLNLRGLGGASQSDPSQGRESTSLVDESTVIGRGSAVEKIVESLVSDEFGGTTVSVFPIVGMAGIGKTTVAQLVFNDERVKSYFEPRIWIHVSEIFDVKRLTKAIIESATGKIFELMDLNSLHLSLREKLKGKRFLLVLDDVWNESRSAWESLRKPLTSGARGSKVLLTTQSETVSRIMGTSPSYCLTSLSNEDCWVLFKKIAFAEGNSDAHPRLETVGKEIAKKLKGLPLAAKTLGGLLYSKKHEDEWKVILKSEIWELPANGNDILPALQLSYRHLPAHLKQCFVYCSVFTKGSTFDKTKLVQHWIAQGYVRPSRMREMEDIGGQYFDDLICRSLFQHYRLDKSRFTMHDLIHDLAQSISVGESVIVKDDEQCKSSKLTRHCSVTCDNLSSWESQSSHNLKSLRTLILRCVHRTCISRIPHDLVLKSTNLRVLDLSKSCITELPDSIHHLKQLRLLDLSYCNIIMLPESVCNLYNLQTLKLKSCDKLQVLPKDMNKLINLRHLEEERGLVCTIKGIGRLTSLQELYLFKVVREIGYKLEELKDLTGLRGKLRISKLEMVVDVHEASEAKLNNKQKLQELELAWTADRHINSIDQGKDEHVLQELQPHANLEVLVVRGYGGLNFPSWFQSPPLLPNLVRISLFNCKRCEVLPPLGQLPFLNHVIIRKMPRLRRLGHEFCGSGKVSGFPSLEKLQIWKVPELEEWTGVEIGEFPCLHLLLLSECPKLKVLPNLSPALRKLTVIKCPQLMDFAGSFPSLHLLNLTGCNERILSSARLLHLKSLTMLQISGFRKLTSLQNEWLQHLTALKDLTIRNLDELVSLEEVGFEFLVSLRRLKVESCPKLKSLLDGAAPQALEELEVDSCQDLKTLIEGVTLQDLTSIRRLQIVGCHSLECLPTELKNLTSLSHLYIKNCHRIRSLPELPNSVKRLVISHCQLLKECCQKEIGEDWHKISHIPNIWIDDQQILNTSSSTL